MKSLILGLGSLGLLFSTCIMVVLADDARDKAIEKDRKQIAGTWRVTSMEVNGNRSDPDDVRKITVVNAADGTWTLKVDAQVISKGTSTIDPTQKIKTIDFTATEGEGKDQIHHGIYELGEKTRKLCFAPAGQARPVEFASSPGSEHVLVVFERVTDPE